MWATTKLNDSTQKKEEKTLLTIINFNRRSIDRSLDIYMHGNVRFTRLKTNELDFCLHFLNWKFSCLFSLFRSRCMTPSGNRDSPRTVSYYSFNTQQLFDFIIILYYRAHQSAVVEFSSLVTTNKLIFLCQLISTIHKKNNTCNISLWILSIFIFTPSHLSSCRIKKCGFPKRWQKCGELFLFQ